MPPERRKESGLVAMTIVSWLSSKSGGHQNKYKRRIWLLLQEITTGYRIVAATKTEKRERFGGYDYSYVAE